MSPLTNRPAIFRLADYLCFENTDIPKMRKMRDMRNIPTDFFNFPPAIKRNSRANAAGLGTTSSDETNER